MVTIATIVALVYAGLTAVPKLLDNLRKAEREEVPRRPRKGRKQAPTRAERAERSVPRPRVLDAEDYREMEDWLSK